MTRPSRSLTALAILAGLSARPDGASAAPRPGDLAQTVAAGEDGLEGPQPEADLNALIRLIADARDPGLRRDLLVGTLESLGGRRRMPMPSAWPSAAAKLADAPDAEARDLATRLALVFGDPDAFRHLRSVAADPAAPRADRVGAIEALARSRDDGLAPVLLGLLADPAVRAPALRGLAATDHEATPASILRAYPTLTPDERADAIGTLAARPGYALALIDAVGRGEVPRGEVPAAAIRALAGHTDSRVKEAMAKVWGAVRPSPAEKGDAIARLRRELTPEALARADRAHGRSVFARTCASCHKLFDAGGNVGPELTGAQRTNVDYLLANVVDPSAIVGNEYRVTVFETADGRVLSGIVRREDERSVTIQTATDLVQVPRSEVEARRPTAESMMPEGLLGTLGKDEVRDLVAYLAGPGQVPLPARADARAPGGGR